MTKLVDEKLKKIEGEFETLEEKRKQLTDQGADLQRELQLVIQEQVRLQGAARTLNEMKAEESTVKPKIPKGN